MLNTLFNQVAYGVEDALHMLNSLMCEVNDVY